MNGRRRTFAIVATTLAVAAAVLFGRPWAALGYHALSYRVTGSGEAANVVIDGSTVFASRADRGVEIIDARSGKVLGTVAPPAGSESVDDVAIADQGNIS